MQVIPGPPGVAIGIGGPGVGDASGAVELLQDGPAVGQSCRGEPFGQAQAGDIQLAGLGAADEEGVIGLAPGPAAGAVERCRRRRRTGPRVSEMNGGRSPVPRWRATIEPKLGG